MKRIISVVLAMILLLTTVFTIPFVFADNAVNDIIVNTFDESDWSESDANLVLATLDGATGKSLRFFKATSFNSERTGNDIRHYKIYNPQKVSGKYEDYKPLTNTTYKLTFRYNSKSYNNNSIIINVRGVEGGTVGEVLNRAVTIKKSLKLSEYEWDTAVVYFKTPATQLDAIAITFEWDGTYDITNNNTNFVVDDVTLETAPASFVVANTFEEDDVNSTTLNRGSDDTVFVSGSTDMTNSLYNNTKTANASTKRSNSTLSFRAARTTTHSSKVHFEIYDYSKGLGADGKLQSFEPKAGKDYTINFDYKIARSPSQDLVITVRPVTVDGSGKRVLGNKIATAVSIPKNDSNHPSPAVWKTTSVDVAVKKDYAGLALTVEASGTVTCYTFFDNVVVSEKAPDVEDDEAVFEGTYFENTYEEEGIGNTTANKLKGANIFHLGKKSAAEREGRVIQFNPISGKTSIAEGNITHVQLYNPNSSKFAPIKPKVGNTYKITFDFKTQVKDDDIFFNIRAVKDDVLGNILATAATVKKGDPSFTGRYMWSKAIAFVTVSEELSGLAITIETNKEGNVNYYPYLDNIAVTVVPQGNTTINLHGVDNSGSVTLPNTTLFSDIPFGFETDKKFDGWYLDANFNTPATENIYGHSNAYAKWKTVGDEIKNTYDDGFYLKTHIEEEGTPTDEEEEEIGIKSGYINRYSDPDFTNSIDGIWKHPYFAYGAVGNDAVNGNAIILTDASLLANTNPPLVRIYDNTKDGKPAYKPHANTVYKISFEIKTSAILDYDTHIAVKAHTDLPESNNQTLFGAGEFLQYIYTVRDGVSIREWTKVEGYITIPNYEYDYLGISLATTNNKSDQTGAEIWIDNVVLTEVIATNYLTVNPENGEKSFYIPFVAGEKLSTIPQFKNDGKIFAGWYTDTAKTVPFTYNKMPAENIEIFAKWTEPAQNATDFSTGFEADDFNSGVTPYTNTGVDNKYTNNMSIHASVINDSGEAYSGDRYLHLDLETNSSRQTMDMTSFVAINPDGSNFQIKAGERYLFKLALRSDYDCYIVPVITEQVPTGKLNFNNSTEFSRIYYRTSIYHSEDTWGEMKVYFTPKVSGKVSFLVYLAGATYFDIDNISIEVMDSSEASIVKFYNEAGTSVKNTMLGGVGDWLFTPVPSAKSGHVFDGWYDKNGNQYVESVFPSEDLDLYPRYRVAEDLSNPETFKDGTLNLDFEANTAEAQSFYQSNTNSLINNKDAIFVANDPSGAHSGGNYFKFNNAGQWTKALYRRFRLFDDNSIGNRVYLEPYSVYRVGFWLKVDKTNAAKLLLASFDNTDAMEIMSSQAVVSLTEAEAESIYGDWIYYEGDITTGDQISTLGFMLSGGFTTASVDDVTVRKLAMMTVSFEANGGSAVESIQTLEGQYIVAPVEPEKAGYVFEGWYSDTDFTNLFEFNSTLINKDIKLYAKWSKVKEQEYKEVTTYVKEEITTKNEITDSHLDDKLNIVDNDTVGSKTPVAQENNNSWLIVIIVSGVIVLAAVVFVTILLLKKRKKKTN